MNDLIDRRSVLSGGGGTIAAVATAGLPASSVASEPARAASAAATGVGRLIKAEPSFDALFPTTRYFEIESRIAGAQFAVWVTLPARYDAERAKSYPVVYQMDGNLFLPTIAPFHQSGESDALGFHAPFIMVSVGYPTRESHAWPWLRIRDLTPPGEAVPDVIRQTVEPAVKAGRLSPEEGRRYLAMFSKPAGDRFLAFLEQELHPGLASNFRIDPDHVGLWGYSYGGLFTAYVAIGRSDLFTTIGAGSPGIIGYESRVFELYRQAVAAKRDYAGRRLHITLGARELAQPGIYQWIIARGTSELLARTSLHPLSGLKVSSEIIPLDRI